MSARKSGRPARRSAGGTLTGAGTSATIRRVKSSVPAAHDRKADPAPMPFATDIDHALRRMHTVATGALTFADLKAHMELAAAAGAASYPELIDARGATLADSVTLDEVRRAAAFLRAMAASGP